MDNGASKRKDCKRQHRQPQKVTQGRSPTIENPWSAGPFLLVASGAYSKSLFRIAASFRGFCHPSLPNVCVKAILKQDQAEAVGKVRFARIC